ncbi:MAG: outer rane lipid asymmetry maintenance protein MlaD [Candidatus Sulfotelmatobacter sp.]|nr:outer rane lipid asymmetry maintenance protein MlaD [Candidatus Sulfotelmatobacter sp.]
MPEVPQATPQAATTRNGRWMTVLIVSIGLLSLVGFAFLKLSQGSSLRLRTCFKDVNGLSSGAKVRLAGVDIGTVRGVKAQPENKACPASVEMEIQTSYELKIPQDSVASTATAGLLGETYLVIDASQASGTPTRNGDLLTSKESVKVTAETVVRAVKAIGVLKQFADEEKDASAESTKTPATQTK